MKRRKKNDQRLEGAEYGVDSRYSSKKEQLADGNALMKARLRRMANVSEKQIAKARLIHLKLKLEEIIKDAI